MTGLLPAKFKESLEKFKSDPEYRELISTSFFSLLVRMIGTGTGFLVTLVTSRYFGAGALGIVSICLAILIFAANFGKLGLDVSLMRFVAELGLKKSFAAIKGTYLSALKMILPTTLLLSGILFFTADWMADTLFHKPYLAPILRINAWLTMPLVLLLIHSECVRGLKKVRSYTFFQTAAVSTIALALLIVAFFSGVVHMYIPVYIQFISIAMAGALSFFNWSRYSKFRDHKAEFVITTKALMKVSAPMFATTIMQLIMSWAGTLILAAYSTEVDVGVYNALVRISVFTNITYLAINSISMPRFAEAFASEDKTALMRNAHEAARLILLTSLPLFFALAVFPKFILDVFGKEFPGNELSLYVLLAGQFIVIISGLAGQILNMTGKQAILRNIAIISALVNVLACFILIPAFGILGVCIAQSLGMLVWNVSCVLAVKRHFGFYTFSFKRN
ncbi:MAG: flippase [Bacteroidetes bacterium]|nr:MAG: flippase [Bacteroidota bacterium]